MNSKKFYRFFLLLCLVVGFGGISTSEVSAHILCRKVILGKVIDTCPHSPSSHSAPAKPATSKPARSVRVLGKNYTDAGSNIYGTRVYMDSSTSSEERRILKNSFDLLSYDIKNYRSYIFACALNDGNSPKSRSSQNLQMLSSLTSTLEGEYGPVFLSKHSDSGSRKYALSLQPDASATGTSFQTRVVSLQLQSLNSSPERVRYRQIAGALGLAIIGRSGYNNVVYAAGGCIARGGRSGKSSIPYNGGGFKRGLDKPAYRDYDYLGTYDRTNY